MLAQKKINNNVVICTDSKGREMIVMGKGLGFGTLPREVSLEEVERSFYDISPDYFELISELPEDVTMIATRIIDIASNELPYELVPNAAFALADHISFAIERAKKQLHVRMPLAYDVKQMYPKEYRIAEYALTRVRKELGIGLPKEEITGIALNIVNSGVSDAGTMSEDRATDEDMLDDITDIIERDFHMIIDRDSFSYSRYATHMQYLFQRIHDGAALNTDNMQMFSSIREEFPGVASCADEIGTHILDKWGYELSEEEKLYLILHINRICTREGL